MMICAKLITKLQILEEKLGKIVNWVHQGQTKRTQKGLVSGIITSALPHDFRDNMESEHRMYLALKTINQNQTLINSLFLVII